MIEIRPITHGDLSFVLDVEQRLFSDPWTRKSLEEELACPFAKSYLLTEDGAPCAYGLFRLMAGEGEVLRIGTLPKHRRRGFARAILGHFLNQGKKEGLEKVFLEVRAGNTPARSLYETLGFREISLRPRYYRDPVEDAVIYEKREKEVSNRL